MADMPFDAALDYLVRPWAGPWPRKTPGKDDGFYGKNGNRNSGALNAF